jgi:hypothetical protein
LPILQTISTFSALLPLIVGSFALRKSKVLLIFWLFLLYGFFTDNMSMWYNLSGESDFVEHYAIINQNIYSLVDAVFLTFFIGHVFPQRKIMNGIYIYGIVLIPLWYYFYFIQKQTWSGEGTMSSYFDSGYEMMLALLAAWAALTLTKPGHDDKPHLLWFVIGIFFHNLVVFFTHAFIENKVIQDIWFITSISNTITMVIYAYAFWLAARSRGQYIS